MLILSHFENRAPLKLVLGGVGFNETESAIFVSLLCSLLPEDPLSELILNVQVVFVLSFLYDIYFTSVLFWRTIRQRYALNTVHGNNQYLTMRYSYPPKRAMSMVVYLKLRTL